MVEPAVLPTCTNDPFLNDNAAAVVALFQAVASVLNNRGLELYWRLDVVTSWVTGSRSLWLGPGSGVVRLWFNKETAIVMNAIMHTAGRRRRRRHFAFVRVVRLAFGVVIIEHKRTVFFWEGGHGEISLGGIVGQNWSIKPRKEPMPYPRSCSQFFSLAL
jgi:hypothetical protein